MERLEKAYRLDRLGPYPTIGMTCRKNWMVPYLLVTCQILVKIFGLFFWQVSHLKIAVLLVMHVDTCGS